MPTILLPVLHLSQRRQADCLAACAAMVITYLGKTVDYEHLMHILGIKHYGAPSSNVTRLREMGFRIRYSQGSIADIEKHLAEDRPCIVFLRTRELPYWNVDTGHAAVVIGLDEANVYLNDPAFESSPQIVPIGDFLLSWMEFDYDYAVIDRRR